MKHILVIFFLVENVSETFFAFENVSETFFTSENVYETFQTHFVRPARETFETHVKHNVNVFETFMTTS